MLEKLTSQNVAQRIILCGLVCLVVFLAITLYKANTKHLAVLTEIEQKNGQILALEHAISTQNAAIAQIKDYSDLAQVRYGEAVAVVKKKNEKLSKTINTLKAEKGTTCADAMPLIDAVVFQ